MLLFNKNKTSTAEAKQNLTTQYIRTGLLFSLPSVSEESKTIFIFHCQVRSSYIYIRWAIADKFITVLTYQLRHSLECIIPLQASSPSCTRTRVFSALTTRRKVKQNSFFATITVAFSIYLINMFLVYSPKYILFPYNLYTGVTEILFFLIHFTFLLLYPGPHSHTITQSFPG